MRIWQQAWVLVENIGQGTTGEWDWGFNDQVQRASVSIVHNIAEGFERDSDADFARFLDIAKGSCREVRSMVYPAED